MYNETDWKWVTEILLTAWRRIEMKKLRKQWRNDPKWNLIRKYLMKEVMTEWNEREQEGCYDSEEGIVPDENQ